MSTATTVFSVAFSIFITKSYFWITTTRQQWPQILGPEGGRCTQVWLCFYLTIFLSKYCVKPENSKLSGNHTIPLSTRLSMSFKKIRYFVVAFKVGLFYRGFSGTQRYCVIPQIMVWRGPKKELKFKSKTFFSHLDFKKKREKHFQNSSWRSFLITVIVGQKPN